jgi:hypothetical protein
MTALTQTHTRASQGLRILNVVRMQFVNKQTFVWVPLMILGGAFVLSLLIFAMIPYDGPKVGGGSQAPLWYFLIIGVQSLTLTFPFSQAMSITRREFFFGTMLTAAVASLMLAVIFVVGGLVEEATNGWGLNGYFFFSTIPGLWESGPWAAMFVYFAVAMLFFVTGFWAATIYRRFGTMGITLVLVAVGLVLVGLFWLAGRLDAWAAIGVWLAEQGPVGLTSWALLYGAVLAVVSFLLLRRTTT